MSYKLIKDVREVLYWEFRPGEYLGKYKKNDFFDNTIYFNSDAMAIIDDCIQRAKNYIFDDPGHRGYYDYNKKRIRLMAGELKIRLAEIIEDKDLSNRYSDKVINDLKKHKVEIVAMIKELIEWLENLKVKKLSIIGPDTEFFNMLLRSEE